MRQTLIVKNVAVLLGTFMFFSGCSDSRSDEEMVLVKEVFDVDTIAAYQEYLAKYPSGAISRLSKKIIELETSGKYLKPILVPQERAEVVPARVLRFTDGDFLVNTKTSSPFHSSKPRSISAGREHKFESSIKTFAIFQSRRTNSRNPISVDDGFFRQRYYMKVVFDNATNTTKQLIVTMFLHENTVTKTIPPKSHLTITFNLDSQRDIVVRNRDIVEVKVLETTGLLVDDYAFLASGSVRGGHNKYIFNIGGTNSYSVLDFDYYRPQ